MRLSLIAFAAALALTPAMASAQAAAPAAAAAGYSTENSTIEQLMGDPAARAVVDKHLPGLLASEQIEMAKAMTLKQVSGFAPDRVSADALAKIDADLAKVPAKK